MTTTNDTRNDATEKKTAATPLEQANVYLYQGLRTLESNAKPKHLVAQIRIAINEYVHQSNLERTRQVDRATAAEHHAEESERRYKEALSYQQVLSDAYDNQRTLTRNALIESRSMCDARYALEDEVRHLKQQAGDAPAAQDVIDRLRKHIALLDDTVSSYEMTIATQADQLLAKDQRITEIVSDVRNAENNSDRLSVELDGVRAQLKEAHHQVEREQQAVQQLLEKNRILHEAAKVAGEQLRGHDADTDVLYCAMREAQSSIEKYLTGDLSERQTFVRLMRIIEEGNLFKAMRGSLRNYAQQERKDA